MSYKKIKTTLETPAVVFTLELIQFLAMAGTWAMLYISLGA